MLIKRSKEELLNEKQINVFIEFCSEYDYDIIIYSENEVYKICLEGDGVTEYSLIDIIHHMIDTYATWIENADKIDCKDWIEERIGYIDILEN